MHRVSALLALLLLGWASPATAQETVPFETLARGTQGPASARNLVITSEQELRAAGIAHLLPPGTRIDWAQETVVAALMGTRSSGGHAIEVKQVLRTRTVNTSVTPGLPILDYEVQVERRGPPPGAMVTAALTAPFHIVKFSRRTGRVRITDAAPAAPDAAAPSPVAFETLARGTQGPASARNLVITSEQELQAAGIAHLLPPGTRIDWAQETVVAALMGTRSSGGHAIEVKQVLRTRTVNTSVTPGLPILDYEVQVERRGPPPGAMVTAALTAPFHIVKFSRRTGRVRFTDVADGAVEAIGRGPESTSTPDAVRTPSLGLTGSLPVPGQ